MKEKLLRFASYILVAALASTVTFALFVPRDSDKLAQLDRLITQRFIGEADREVLLDAAANAMVSATGDRWSYYMSAQEYAAYKEQSANAYVGIGITILEEEEGFRIIEVAPGGGAMDAGLQVNDLVVEVEGQGVRDMTSAQVRALVQGKEGTAVRIRVLREEANLEFQVERRKIETVVASWEMLPEEIGLIRIENFDSRCADETIKAIEAALESGAQALIFDVRSNPGGYASELVEVLDYLLPEGELFRTVSYDGTQDVDVSDADFLDVPMAVLVNARSYSAAEFFAAALQEYEAATVVGEQTVGKGYYQITYTLGDGSAVALSVGKYFTPRGVSLADVGITPDIPVPFSEEEAAAFSYGTLAPGDDPQIQAAADALILFSD